MKVAILGCGPAGLLAAQAVAEAGHKADILSRKVKSKISGAQFIDREIPGIITTPFEVRFVMNGDGETYTRRLYDGHPVPVLSSWHNYEPDRAYKAWNMDAIYDALWEAHESSIFDMDFNQEVAVDVLGQYQTVISTIPRPAVIAAMRPDFTMEWFPSRKVWIKPDFAPATALPDNTIVYNGTDDYGPLYRFSKIQGNTSGEFISRVEGGIEVTKPIRYDGPPVSDRLFFFGRYGAWSKMNLVTHAYFATRELFAPWTELPA